MRIALLTGMPGVGKTALAVRFAHTSRIVTRTASSTSIYEVSPIGRRCPRPMRSHGFRARSATARVLLARHDLGGAREHASLAAQGFDQLGQQTGARHARTFLSLLRHRQQL